MEKELLRAQMYSLGDILRLTTSLEEIIFPSTGYVHLSTWPLRGVGVVVGQDHM